MGTRKWVDLGTMVINCQPVQGVSERPSPLPAGTEGEKPPRAFLHRSRQLASSPSRVSCPCQATGSSDFIGVVVSTEVQGCPEQYSPGSGISHEIYSIH